MISEAEVLARAANPVGIDRRHSDLYTFDTLPCPDATLTDLSEDRFRLTYLRRAVSEDVIAEKARPLKQQLASLRFFDLGQDCPTNAGILVLSDTPTRYLPGAYVQFVRYAGEDLASDVVTEKRAMGDLRTVLQTLDLLIDVNIRQRPPAEFEFDAHTFSVTLRPRPE